MKKQFPNFGFLCGQCYSLFRVCLLILLLIGCTTNMMATSSGIIKNLISVNKTKQQITVTGIITDELGAPVPGVNVLEKGSSNNTISDLNGNYSISVSSTESVLVFSFFGFATQEIVVGDQTVIDVRLLPEMENIDEVVVVGYGVKKKSDVTGSLISVNEGELKSRPVGNALEAMQGKAAGVDITSNERPGELGTVKIRGTRSFTATSDPLYVVDGVTVMSTSTIETINPRDIESIDILKDASATAIYGSRGANGVIIITTKRGKEGKTSLEYSGSVSIESIQDRAPMMNASDYITWRRWACYNAGQTAVPGDQPTWTNDSLVVFKKYDVTSLANIKNGWASGSWDGSQVISTDWTDFVTQTAITQEHTVSASGGTEKMSIYGSFGYLDQNGTQKGQTYERYTAKVSIDIKPVSWFSMGGNLNGSWSDQDYGMSTLGASSSSGPNDIYRAAQRIFSYTLPYDANGEIITKPGGDDMVYTIIDEWNKSTQQRQMFRVLGSFYGQLDFGNIFTPLKGLRYRVNFGPEYRNWREGVFIDKNSVNRGSSSFARLKNQRDLSWTLDNIVSYDNTFGKHTLGATFLQTASVWNIETNSLQGENVPSSSFTWNAFSSLDVSSTSAKVGIESGLSRQALTSYMARFNYTFDNKYMLTVSGRWDGASQLAEGEKWAFFPSAALAWRMEQENFLKDIDWISQLKLRLGVGSTGNAGVKAYQTIGSSFGIYVPFGGSANALGITPNEPNYKATLKTMPNSNLTWENTTQYNVGLDFSILKGRIAGSVDGYMSYTKDLLMTRTLSPITGYPSMLENVGETKNKGVDLALNTINIQTEDFQWSTNINAAWQQDEIVSLAYGKNNMIDNYWFIGESISVIYGIDGDGIWQESDSEEMNLYNSKGANFKVGMAKPVDQNGDTIINASDRVIIGNTNPRWTFGMTNTFTYKGFELSCMLYGRFGYKISTGGEAQLGRYNQREIDYWTPSNPNAEYQKPIYNEAGGDTYYSVLGYRSGSFLKIRMISLGYNFPKSILKKLGLQSLKVYAQAKNPGYIYSAVDWMDLDLSVSKNGTTGNAPVINTILNRGFVFGLNVGF